MNTIIVFAKEPRLGRVKTRLAKEISEKQALALYQSFLNDTLDCVRRLEKINPVLAWDGEGDPSYLKSIAEDFMFYQQWSGDLGERMHHAFEHAYRQGASKIVIIGSDAPTLPSEFIKGAFDRLDQYDVVIGPSDDGGYYLVGLKTPDEHLFVDTEWSVSTTRDQTLLQIKKSGKTVCMLPQWFDVDTKEDLDKLQESLARDWGVGAHTRKALEKWYSSL